MGEERSSHTGRGLWRRTVAPVWLSFCVSLVVFHAIALHVVMYRVLTALHFNDFGKFYYGAQMWRSGGTLYGPTVATLIPLDGGRAGQFWNLNPPHFHALIWPLLDLPIGVAYVVWAGINVLVALAAVTAAVRAAGLRLSAIGWLGILALFAASSPVLAWAATGQLTGLLMGSVTAAWLALRRGRWNLAAVAIGIVCSVKIFLAPLALYFVIKRRWNAALLAGVSAAAPFVVGVVVFGWTAHEQWVQALREVHWTGAVMNASLQGLLGRTWSLDIFVVDPRLNLAAAVMSLGVLVVGCTSVSRTDDPDAAMLTLLSTSLLASPLGWVYYLPIIAGPLLVMLARRRLNAWVYVSLGALLVPFSVLSPYPSRAFAFTAGSLFTWSLLGMWVVMLRANHVEAVRSSSPDKRDGVSMDRADTVEGEPSSRYKYFVPRRVLEGSRRVYRG